jgi:hypothetical protein
MENTELKMKKNISGFIAAASLLLSANTFALSIVQADAFTVGDNKAALETSTGLVWMDFGVNNNETYAEVTSKFSSDYLGWRLPTEAEVKHLWHGLFGHIPGWQSDTGMGFGQSDLDAGFDSIFSILGSGKDITHAPYDENGVVLETWTVRRGFGLFAYESGNYGMILMEQPYDTIHYDESLILELFDDASDWYGTMLVKSDVPESSSIVMLALGLFGLGWSRRRSANALKITSR